MVVMRLNSITGQSTRAPSCASCQLSPPSVERYTPAGRVPANTVSGSPGSTISAHTAMSFMALSSRCQLSPASSERYTPAWVPA